MMQIKFNSNNFVRVYHSLAACQRHTPSSLAAAIGLSNNDVISLRSLRSLRCVRHFVISLRALRWLETPLYPLIHSPRIVVRMRREELLDYHNNNNNNNNDNVVSNI